LVRHSAAYLLARGGPGLINFLALAAYSRLLTPHEYGQYSLVLAGLGLVQVCGFQWLNQCLIRFLPASRIAPERLLSEIKFVFRVLALAFSAAGLVVAVLLDDPIWQRLIAVGVPLLIAQAWFELNLAHAAASLKPGLYGRINLAKSSIALTLGGSLAWLGLGAHSPLLGLLLGTTVATMGVGRSFGRNIRPIRPEKKQLKAMAAYGMPLAANFVLAWVLVSSDRFLLGWLLDIRSAGQYAVSYDLAQYSIAMLLMIVNLSAYPLVLHAFEVGGEQAARNQLQRNGALIFALAFSAVGGIAVSAPLLSELLLGAEYQSTAVRLLPWVALGAALAGIKAYHFDVAFHLGRDTGRLFWISVSAALVNLVFNLVWIPQYGMLGAAYATVLAYLVSLLASAWIGRRVFALPAIGTLVIPALIVSVPTTIAAYIGVRYGGWHGLALSILLGMFVSMACAISIDLVGIRKGLRLWFQARKLNGRHV
jgi:O-antigen/teichoic acid export membrane protein